jgi:signal peptide peptidase SppA
MTIAPNTVRRLLTDLPFMADGSLASIVCQNLGDLIQAAEHPAYRELRQELKPKVGMVGDIAVVPIQGTLARRPDVAELLWYDFEATENVQEMVSSVARNPDVTGILLDIDSPGGFLTGGPEVADSIRRAAGRKPVVAWTGGMMASLAYWIGSQATEVIASRSAVVGSIGVFAGMYDYSKLFEEAGIKVELFKNREATFKASGFPGTSLSEEQRGQIQSSIQATFAEFRDAVVSARPAVGDDSMRGQTFTGREGVSLGLVDRVGDREFAIGVLRSMVRRAGGI